MKRGGAGTVFEWKPAEVHGGRMFLSFFVVIGIFVGVGSVVRVTVASAIPEANQRGSLLYVADDEVGKEWIMRAIESGPFPTGMAERKADRGMDLALIGSIGRASWGGYESELRQLEDENGIEVQKLARKGVRVLPNRKPPRLEEKTVSASGRRMPVISPFDDANADVMPEEVPEFLGELDKATSAGNWRFILKCRANGSVEQCIPLFRAEGDDVKKVMRWLERVTFELKGEPRWVAVRVKFIEQ